jgi:hypothetical protein
MINEDWRYSDKRMKLREKALNLLFARFGWDLNNNGEPLYSNQSIYECAHDWVSQGNMSTFGLVRYYQTYYTS